MLNTINTRNLDKNQLNIQIKYVEIGMPLDHLKKLYQIPQRFGLKKENMIGHFI